MTYSPTTEREAADLVLAILAPAFDGLDDPDTCVRAARPYFEQMRRMRRERLVSKR